MTEEKQFRLAEFEIPDFREITETGQRMLLEVEVRKNGIWRIHKSDPDKLFPSDFHADRVDAPQKLDIYTGYVYDTRSHQQIFKMPKKVMKYILNQLGISNEIEIKTKLADLTRFTYLN